MSPSHPSVARSALDFETLNAQYRRVRSATLAIASPLSAEDCQVQSMADASPIKWHLAHTTWFFETFLLDAFDAGYRALNTSYKVLFNSYYNGVGNKHPRSERGMISRPSLSDVLAYCSHVDAAIESFLLNADPKDREQIAALMVLGFNHEQQHQELMFTDLKHLLSINPLAPVYAANAPQPRAISASAIQWEAFEGGIVEVGHQPSTDFAFDNESPRHRVLLQPYQIADRLVTNGDYLSFMQDGAYSDHSLWLSDGWDWVQQSSIDSPMYWRQDEAHQGWQTFTLSGLKPIDLEAPVCHVSYFEADAFARWAGVRLPTEFEWEHAANARRGLKQLNDTAWQWTASAYLPYPGFAPARGAVGEYNGKFMNQQYVLRGGSCATPVEHTRLSYRNFFQPDKRWQFTGLRLAR